MMRSVCILRICLWILCLNVLCPLKLRAESKLLAETACTEIGCHSGLTIEVPMNYRWIPGKYRFQFTLDQKKKVLCMGSLPLKSCGIPAISCNDSSILIEESGCALEPKAHGFGNIVIERFPALIELDIFRDKRKISHLQAKPFYRELTPNGPHCPSRCKQAQLTIQFLN